MLAIYARVSKDRENQKSIKEQILLGKEFALKNGFPKVEVYKDVGLSGGGDISTRPGFDKMLQDIEDGIISAVYLYHQDRAEREEVTWFKLANLIIDRKLEYYEGGVSVDLSNPATYFEKGLLSQMNSLFRKSTSKRIKDVLKRNVQEGKVHGAILPYGYKKDEENFLIIDEIESQVVKRIYSLSLDGVGQRSIASMLTKEGVPTRYNILKEGTLKTRNKYTDEVTIKNKGEIKWAGKTVGDIIKNPIYKGKRRWNNDFVDAPAIVSKEYWERVNNNLAKNRNNSGKKLKHNYLLKGLLRCGYCGKNYYGRTRVSRKDHFYMCSSKRYPELNCGNRSINIDKIENFVWSRFFVDRELKGIIDKHFETKNLNTKKNSILADKENVISIIKSLKTRKNKAIELTLDGEIDEKDISGIVKKLNNKIQEEEQNIQNLKLQLQDLEEGEKMVSKFNSEFQRITQVTTFEEKKELIRKYVKNIEITTQDTNYQLDVDFHYGIPSERYFSLGFHDSLFFQVKGTGETREVVPFIPGNIKKPESMKETKFYSHQIFQK